MHQFEKTGSFVMHMLMLVCLGLVPTGPLEAQGTVPMPPEKTVEVFGQPIHYYEAGQGPHVILLHGLGGEGSNWSANIWTLAQKYHVVALDQIGFGHSGKPLIEYRIETFVDFLRAFMAAQTMAKATLVGNSLGGWIAVDFAARHPEMVDKLVLVDAAGLRHQASDVGPPVDLNPASVEGMRRVLERIVYNQQFVTEELAARLFEQRLSRGDGYTIQRFLAGLASASQFEDEKLGTIRAPTLVIWGRDDQLIRVSVGERFQKGIRGAQWVVFDQCGHVPQIEKAEEFNAAVLKFLAEP